MTSILPSLVKFKTHHCFCILSLNRGILSNNKCRINVHSLLFNVEFNINCTKFVQPSSMKLCLWSCNWTTKLEERKSTHSCRSCRRFSYTIRIKVVVAFEWAQLLQRPLAYRRSFVALDLLYLYPFWGEAHLWKPTVMLPKPHTRSFDGYQPLVAFIDTVILSWHPWLRTRAPITHL